MPSKTPEPVVPEVRKGQGDMHISADVFRERLRERFHDPAFERTSAEIDKIIDIAWRAYQESHKSPRTRAAGERFADPEMQLSVQWLATRDAIAAAQREHDDPQAKSRVLVICGAARNDQTCPGEMSKTYRLCSTARGVLSSAGDFEVDFLDLSRLTAEYGRIIYPCKACVSTAMPLCHWPCSCYPNHGLGQVQDWMGEIYPRWVAAHAVMIVTPVYWYQAPRHAEADDRPAGVRRRRQSRSDFDRGQGSGESQGAGAARLVLSAASGGPRLLSCRARRCSRCGDAAALAQRLARGHGARLSGQVANFDRYVGYYEPYATSHDALDQDAAIHEEVRNAARALMGKVRELRGAKHFDANALESPRPK
jgi:hypothetical protein